MSSVVSHVSLGAHPASPGPAAALAERARPSDVRESLDVARDLGEAVFGSTPATLLDQWEALATLAARDVGLARTVEPHLDALSILHEAGALVGGDHTSRAWGVFAAEGGDEPLRAVRDGDSWRLTGVKPWCSLASRLDSALVTATEDASDSRRLFAVELQQPGVTPDDSAWVARGLTEIPSGPVRFASVPARPIGEPGWYLARPGFSWGGIGVAACWYGGAVGVARRVWAAVDDSRDPHALAHLGAIDELLQSSRRALAEAAALAETPHDDGPTTTAGRTTAGRTTDPRLAGKRVRATVARAGEEIVHRASRVLGPAPLALEADYAKRVADLQLYLRQHHAERDLASLGAALVKEHAPW